MNKQTTEEKISNKINSSRRVGGIRINQQYSNIKDTINCFKKQN